MLASKPMPPQESGRRGARKRWGPPRMVRLDELDPDERAIVLELVGQLRAGHEAAAADASKPATASREVTRDDQPIA